MLKRSPDFRAACLGDEMETEAWAAESGEMSFQVPLSSTTYATVHVTLAVWAPKNLEMVGSEFRKKSA